MTKKELLEAIEDMPMDAEIWTYTGAFYRQADSVDFEELWIEGVRKKVIRIHGYKGIQVC